MSYSSDDPLHDERTEQREARMYDAPDPIDLSFDLSFEDYAGLTGFEHVLSNLFRSGDPLDEIDDDYPF